MTPKTGARLLLHARLALAFPMLVVVGCGGEDAKATDPEIVSKAERAVEADAKRTLADQDGGDLFEIRSISCKPFSDRQLDCSGLLAGPEGSGPDSGVGWRATVDPETGEVEVEQRSGLR